MAPKFQPRSVSKHRNLSMYRKGATKRLPQADCNIRPTSCNIISPSYPAYHKRLPNILFYAFLTSLLNNETRTSVFLEFLQSLPFIIQVPQVQQNATPNCSKYLPTQLYNMAYAQIILRLPSTPFWIQCWGNNCTTPATGGVDKLIK